MKKVAGAGKGRDSDGGLENNKNCSGFALLFLVPMA